MRPGSHRACAPLWFALLLIANGSMAAEPCEPSVSFAISELTLASKRWYGGLPDLRSRIDAARLTVSDPAVFDLIRSGTYSVVEGRVLLAALEHGDELEACDDAKVIHSISARLDWLLTKLGLSVLSHNGEHASTEKTNSVLLKTTIQTLNGTRESMLSLLLRPVDDAPWAITVREALFIRSKEWPDRACVLSKMEGTVLLLSGDGLCADTDFIPSSSYAEQMYFLKNIYGGIFHAYPSITDYSGVAALKDELHRQRHGDKLNSSVAELTVNGFPLAYIIEKSDKDLCVHFFQVLIPHNAFHALTPHSFNGTLCQSIVGDTEENARQNILGLLQNISFDQ
jgi:hypothetical protein